MIQCTCLVHVQDKMIVRVQTAQREMEQMKSFDYGGLNWINIGFSVIILKSAYRKVCSQSPICFIPHSHLYVPRVCAAWLTVILMQWS